METNATAIAIADPEIGDGHLNMDGIIVDRTMGKGFASRLPESFDLVKIGNDSQRVYGMGRIIRVLRTPFDKRVEL